MEKSTRIASPSEVGEKKWFLIDAAGKTVGKVSVEVSRILRGKGKVCFTSHQDLGDYVVVINAGKVVLTGNKLTDKMYYRHSGYPGGFREERAKDVIERKPETILMHSVKGMLPKNKLAKLYMTRLRVFPGSEHQHVAQSPIEVRLGGRHGA
ncbi:MAG: 50S ribosomal protein L13 [Nitrospirae bacterium]|jgi:large subunit ribosomal protein L13|nr:50S ribosomal protein L13 [Nitrospirota bacterium]